MSTETMPSSSSSYSKEFKPTSPLTKQDSGVGVEGPKIDSSSKLGEFIPPSASDSNEKIAVDSVHQSNDESSSSKRRPGRPPASKPKSMDLRHPQKPHTHRPRGFERRRPNNQGSAVEPVVINSLPGSPLENIETPQAEESNANVLTQNDSNLGEPIKINDSRASSMSPEQAANYDAEMSESVVAPVGSVEETIPTDDVSSENESVFDKITDTRASSMTTEEAAAYDAKHSKDFEVSSEAPIIETPPETPTPETPTLETPTLETPTLETPTLETPIPDVPEPPAPELPEPPVPESPDSSTEVSTLFAGDTAETDMDKARLLADRQLDGELRELREELYEINYRGTNRLSRIVRTVARSVRSTFIHPIDTFRYISRSTFLREGFRQHYIREHFGESEGVNFHNAVAQEVARRIDLGEDFLFEGEQILREDVPEVRQVKDQLNEVFRRGIAEGLTRENVLEEAKRILAGASWIEQGTDGHVHMVQNLDAIYDRIITAVDHEAGLASIDAAYRLAGGSASLGAEARAERTTTDRIMERLTNSRLKGFLVNEATVAVAVGAAVSIAGYFARSKGARLLTGALVGGPVGIVAAAGSAGLFAAARERMTLRQERAMEMERVALGGAIGGEEGETGPRRTEVDATLYDMISATEVIGQLGGLIPEDVSTMDEDSARALFATIVALRTNQTLGDQNSVDLIRYTSEDLVEQEKTDLMVLRAQAEIALAQFAQLHPEFMQNIEGATIQEKLAFAQRLNATETQGFMSERDEAFRRLTRRRATQRGLATFAFAGAASYVSSQITEHFKADATPGKASETITLRNHEQAVGFKGDTISIPRGWKVEGTSLIDNKGNHVTDNFHFGPQGGVARDTVAELRSKGFGFSDKVSTKTVTVSREVPYNEYVAMHPERFQVVHREGWMGNNTPMWQDSSGRWHGADLNELGGRFGTDGQGNVILGTSPMTDSGSFQEAIRIAAHSEQAAGRLKWILTPDKNNPSHSIVLDVNPDGSVLVPKGTDAHTLFNIDPSGKVTLRSGYAEVAVPTGRVGADGGQGYYILATQVGNNPPGNIPIIETKDIFSHHGSLVVRNTIPGVEPVDPFAPFIPIAAPLPRRPLERITTVDNTPYITSPYLVGYNGGEMSPEEEERVRARFSPRLRENPDVVLEPRVEIIDYLDRMGSERAVELEDLAAQVEPMSEECRVSVLMPVNGAQEGDNIYNTLKWYSGQVDADGNPLDPNFYEIVLLVNKPETMEWDNTLDEIERFRRDFPGTTIRVVTKEYSKADAKIGRIRKDLADMTLLRQSRRSSAEDVVLVSNDADCKGLGQTYLDTISTQITAQSADGLAGRLEWDPATSVESPLYHMGVKVMQMFDLIDRHPRPGSGRKARFRYPGANFAFKSSMYAATGGYDSTCSKAEDVVLGRTIKLARKNSTTYEGVGFYGGDNIVYTDSRRGVTVFNKGYPPSMQWSKLSFGPEDEAREGAELEDRINYDILLEENPKRLRRLSQRRARRKFEAEFKNFIEQTVQEYALISKDTEYHEGMRMPEDLELVMRSLEALRVKADVDVSGGVLRVNFLDISRVYEYLRNYRQAGPRSYAARTGLNRIFSGGFGELFPETKVTS